MTAEAPPPHHAPDGGFRDPWPPHPDAEDRTGGFLRWMWDRLGSDLPANPSAEEVPREAPDPAYPRAPAGEIRATFVGHATVLLQVGGLNLLTDPIWSDRAGPFSLLAGPRFAGPGLRFDDLPPLDGVLLSHDHYDHLDAGTVEMLRERAGPGLPWITPLGYGSWLGKRGFTRVRELDWWEETELAGASGPLRVVCLPARHWTRRGPRTNRRLWSSWAVLPGNGDQGIYFGGDSAYCDAFAEIGDRFGPFRMTILPIGAYEPRWFMAPSHMNPEEAVQAYLDLGGRGRFLGMHWGAFRLTDEDPLEPPVRCRAAWSAAGLPDERLHLPGNGGTVVLEEGADAGGGGSPGGDGDGDGAR